MNFKFILGVDMSKEWFNFCLMNKELEILWEGEIVNSPDPIFTFLSDLSKRKELVESQTTLSEVTLVLEHTGIYVNHLVNAYLSKGGVLSLVHAAKVSEWLSGKVKWDEKTDKLDARRLAEYGIRYSDKLQLWQAKEETLVKLQALQRQRSRFVEVIKVLTVPTNESVSFNSASVSEMLVNNQKQTIEALKSDLKKIEEQLVQLIEQDPYLKNLYKLITSVVGVGPATAREVIITTAGFKDFTPNQSKQFARYSGVTPKEKQSGKYRRAKKTTKKGNKELKTLLTLCASSLLKGKSELALYYRRKVKEGKDHFTIINAMRNKLILRIFAVVRNQVIYDKNLNFSPN